MVTTTITKGIAFLSAAAAMQRHDEMDQLVVVVFHLFLAPEPKESSYFGFLFYSFLIFDFEKFLEKKAKEFLFTFSFKRKGRIERETWMTPFASGGTEPVGFHN